MYSSSFVMWFDVHTVHIVCLQNHIFISAKTRQFTAWTLKSLRNSMKYNMDMLWVNAVLKLRRKWT